MWTTLNDVDIQAVKRMGKDFVLNASFTYERYKAPIYLPGEQTVTTTNIQLTWFPTRNIHFYECLTACKDIASEKTLQIRCDTTRAYSDARSFAPRHS
jgi:hypothetical protein